MTREAGAALKAGRIAVRRGENDAESAALTSYVGSASSDEVEYFESKDDADLNDALCSGRFDRAVFLDLNALLTTIWSGYGKIDRWKDAGVTLELVQPPDGDADAWRATVDATFASHSRWCTRQRRNQIVAACVLSALALAAAIVLLVLVPPSR